MNKGITLLQFFTVVFFVVIFPTGCTMQKVVLDVQGHRGCRGLRPENTIAAMLYALELGVTTLEMDVVITGDEKVIVSHEPYFNHLKNILFL